jgi:hypothetical protein
VTRGENVTSGLSITPAASPDETETPPAPRGSRAAQADGARRNVAAL